jgi:hypothetical protein
MSIDKNGPDTASSRPAQSQPHPREQYGTDVGQTAGEPKQSAAERPADWNPPPGNPGSDQDAQTDRSNSGTNSDNDGVDPELGFDPDSPDLSDPQIDPPHPARTSNDPAP